MPAHADICAATQVRLFCDAINRDSKGLGNLVTVQDGVWAVAIGIAAQKSLALGGMPVAVEGGCHEP